MPLIVGIPKESAEGERRVALVPDAAETLAARGLEVRFERGAGEAAGFPDALYEAAGAHAVAGFADLAREADVLFKVQPPAPEEIAALRPGTRLIGLLKPLDAPEIAAQLAERGVDAFSMELMPRITRAQSMDVLSSQSTIAGYRAVLLAATTLPRIFPMLVTAAGTLHPARVLVIGAGVAGLQALGTARRLGAMTSAYDTRPAVREQVESLGARFIELDLDTGEAEDAGGYARAQSEAFYQRQRAELARHVVQADVVITTALVPGQRAPLLIEESAVVDMKPASVIVDLAAEKGGNCAITEPGRDVTKHGVTLIGRTNLPAEVPAHASQMYAKNVVTFFEHLLGEGDPPELALDREDEITAGTLVTHEGRVVHEAVRARLGPEAASAAVEE